MAPPGHCVQYIYKWWRWKYKHEKKEPTRKNVIYLGVSVRSRLQSVMCEVDDEKCACSEYAILILSFFSLSLFFSTEWPCLIDWSPESTTDRHIQSSTQTDDGDGREEKNKRTGEISWGNLIKKQIALLFSLSRSLYLYTMYSDDHEVLVFVLLDCMNSCLIDINGSYHHALENKKRITESSSLLTGNVSIRSTKSFVSQRKTFEIESIRRH